MILENGKLFSLRPNSIKTELIPLTQELFRLEGRDDMRLKILLENGKVTGLERLFADGNSLQEAKK